MSSRVRVCLYRLYSRAELLATMCRSLSHRFLPFHLFGSETPYRTVIEADMGDAVVDLKGALLVSKTCQAYNPNSCSYFR